MWDLLRGATALKAPEPSELARRYTDLLVENLGQPGFRELLIAVHDLDAGRDLIERFTISYLPSGRDLTIDEPGRQPASPPVVVVM